MEQYRTPENGKLTEASRAFLGFLMSKHDRYRTITAEDITGVVDIRQQYEKIDVYCVVALVDGSRISLIIEDKVETSQHSDQLHRYLDVVRGDNIPEDDLVGIYFKTGLVTEEDEQLPPEFALLRREELLAFLKGLDVSHLILDEYIAYLDGVDAEYREWERQALDPVQCMDALGNAHAQWALMEAIFRKSAAFAQAQGDNYKGGLYNGVNVGGTPWTQFDFWSGPNLIRAHEKDPSEFLMYRLDYRKTWRGEKGKRRPYIGLRRYCKYEKTPENRLRTLSRFQQLREACTASLEAARASGEFALVSERTLSDYSGKFEQELLVFFLDPESNTPDRFVQEIPILHHEIMRRVPEKWPAPKPEHNNDDWPCDELIKPGHKASLGYMATQQFQEVLDVLNEPPEIGGVYCRPIDRGVTVLDLCSESPKPRIGVGEDPVIRVGTDADTIRASLPARIAYLVKKRGEQPGHHPENRFEARMIREAQADQLRLPGFPPHVRFIHSQWRMPDLGFTDLTAVDLQTGSLVLIELKPNRDDGALSQVRKYVEHFRTCKEQLHPFFVELAGVMGRLYQCEELARVELTAPATGAVAWPGVSGGDVEVVYLE